MRVAALVAAAGDSTRMGFPKALLSLPGNQLLLAQHVGECLAGGVDAVWITLPARQHFPGYSAVAQECLWATVVENVFPQKGLLGSVCTVLQRVDAHGLLLLPVDTPGVTRALVAALLAQAKRETHLCCRPCVDGVPGHPLYIPQGAFSRLLEFSGAGGVRAALGSVVEMPWEDALVCDNVNTLDDAARQDPPWKRWHPKGQHLGC